MNGDPLLDHVETCGNCHALNPPNALICASCGVNLAQYQTASHRLLEHQAEQTAAHVEQISEAAATHVAQEISQAKRQLKWQLLIVLVGAAVVIIAIVTGTALYHQHLADEYGVAMTCLSGRDFRCARDRLLGILQVAPDYPEARANLSEARYGLAEQFAMVREWQAAVDELDALLLDSPNNRTAIDLLKDTYERWFADALSRGDWLTAASLRLQIIARFSASRR